MAIVKLIVSVFSQGKIEKLLKQRRDLQLAKFTFLDTFKKRMTMEVAKKLLFLIQSSK